MAVRRRTSAASSEWTTQANERTSLISSSPSQSSALRPGARRRSSSHRVIPTIIPSVPAPIVSYSTLTRTAQPPYTEYDEDEAESTASSSTDENVDDTDDGEEDLDPSFGHAIRYLIASSTPMIIGFVIEGCLQLISTILVGRLGPLPLAIVGQGNQIIGVTGSIVVLSATSVQMTISAPLFTSRHQSRASVGVVAQRAFILSCLSSIPVTIIWWYVEPIMLAMGQPASLAAGLKPYMRMAILSIPGYALMEVAKSYLQSQSIFHPATVIAAAILPVHTALTYVLVFHTSLQEVGAALSLAISEWLIGLALIAWISFTSASDCWDGISLEEACKHWGHFYSMFLPAIVMFGSEWWSFEIVSLFAGRLGETEVAAQAAVTSLDLVLALVPVAGAVASASRIGSMIGHGHEAIRPSIIHVRAAYLVMISYGIFLAIFLIVLREPIARMFTDDRPTIDLMKEVFVPMAIYQISDAMAACGSSILRAFGKNLTLSLIHTFAYYCVGIPLGYVAAFHWGWGLSGLWAGLSFGLLIISVTEIIIYVFMIDWATMMDEGEKRRIRVST